MSSPFRLLRLLRLCGYHWQDNATRGAVQASCVSHVARAAGSGHHSLLLPIRAQCAVLQTASVLVRGSGEAAGGRGAEDIHDAGAFATTLDVSRRTRGRRCAGASSVHLMSTLSSSPHWHQRCTAQALAVSMHKRNGQSAALA
jgi:hypothetical protein